MQQIKEECVKAQLTNNRIIIMQRKLLDIELNLLLYICSNSNIIPNYSITRRSIDPIGLRYGISTSQSEKPGPTDDRHLPDPLHHRVDAKHAKRAAIIYPISEPIAEDHDQPEVRLPGRPVHPAGPAHHLRRRFRPDGQRIVDHHEGAEDCG